MKGIAALLNQARHDEASAVTETCSGTPVEYEKGYMRALRIEFKRLFGMCIEEFLPPERVMPLDVTSPDSLLFGTAVAVKERCLLHADLGHFIRTCPDGYFAIGFGSHQADCPCFVYTKRTGRCTVYLRVPWDGPGRAGGGSGSPDESRLRRLRDFEQEFCRKAASLTAIEVTDEALYDVVTLEGRHYRMDGPLGEADCRLIFEYPVISLPDNIETVKKLQRKLGEYRQRIEAARHEHGADSGCRFADALSKSAILEALLLEGEASTWRVAREIEARYPGIDARAFRNACAVMDDYCRYGGRSVWGGTGLR